MLKISLVLIGLMFQSIAIAQFLTLEQRTVKAAFDSLQWQQFLHAISKKCNDYEYADLAPREDLALLIKSKIKIELEKLEVLAEENENYIVPLYEEINKVNCHKIEVNEFLSEIYDKYDVAKFNLELYEPISKPLMTEREAAQANKETLAEYVKEKAKEAETIVIVELIPWEKASEQYRHKMSGAHFKPKYVYRMLKGWKKSIFYQYMTPPASVQVSLDVGEYKKLMEKDGIIREVLFVNSAENQFLTSHIIGSVNLALFEIDLSFLDKHQWEWVGDRLIE